MSTVEELGFTSPSMPCNKLKILHREVVHPNISSYCEKVKFVEIEVIEFDEPTADMFELKMSEAYQSGQDKIIVRVNSFGGSVYALHRMLSAVQTAKEQGITVVTMCPGVAMSCGSILLAMGSKGYRFCSPNATILLHQISGGLRGKLTDMQNECAEYWHDNQDLFKKIAENAQLEDLDFYYNIVMGINKDLYIHPYYALWLGLVDHVHLPVLEKKVEITYDLKIQPDPSLDEIKKKLDEMSNQKKEIKFEVLGNVDRPKFTGQEAPINPPTAPTASKMENKRRQKDQKDTTKDKVNNTTDYGLLY